MTEHPVGQAAWTDDERLGALAAARLRRPGVRTVTVGDLVMGGNAPLVVQSMTTTPTEDVEATVAQVECLARAGCQLVRLAVPSRRAARAIARIRPRVSVPLAADVHFNHRIALDALEAGVDKLRLNPGNLRHGIADVAREAAARGVPIRIGVNGGSLEPELEELHGGPTAEALVASALRHVELLEAEGFHDILVSLKSSSVPTTLAAYRRMAAQRPYPLHVGVTEAGTGLEGVVKAFLGSGVLVLEGIGETVRVSLTGDPVDELAAVRRLLASLGRVAADLNGDRP